METRHHHPTHSPNVVLNCPSCAFFFSRPTCRHRRFHRPNRGIQMGPHSSSSAPCLRMGGASAARAELWQERGASSHAHVLNRPLQQLMRRGLPFRCPAPRLLQLKITGAEQLQSVLTPLRSPPDAEGVAQGDSTPAQNVLQRREGNVTAACCAAGPPGKRMR